MIDILKLKVGDVLQHNDNSRTFPYQLKVIAINKYGFPIELVNESTGTVFSIERNIWPTVERAYFQVYTVEGFEV